MKLLVAFVTIVALMAVALVLVCGPFATAADKPEGGEIRFRTVWLIPFDNEQDADTLHKEE